MPPALRSLAKSPGFTVVALITLALGIGANTSIYSGLNTVLFRTPYPEDQELVRVHRTGPQAAVWPHSAANFIDQREQAAVFDRLAAMHWTSYNLATPGQPAERMQAMEVTADFFPLLGLAPVLGRVFTAEEDQPGKNNVIVLSHASWLRRFNADPGIVGRELRIDGETATVIGVMPPRFNRPYLWGDIEAWRPLALTEEQRHNRNYSYLGEVARLKRGVSLEQAQAAVSALAAQLAAAHPEFYARTGLQLVPLARSGVGRDGERLPWLVMSLAGFVLLIACANLANLQFARHAARAREQAIRSALGASRWRLMREALAESLLLALGGGALGLLVAMWCNDALTRGRTDFVIEFDRHVLAFTFGASVVTGLAFGTLPAWFASRADVNEALKRGTRMATPDRSLRRVRHALIVAEIALALVLLIGAGIVVRGLQRLTEREIGWRTEGVLTGYLNLRGKNYETYEQHRAFALQLEERLAVLPGVERVAFGTSLPTWGFGSSGPFVVEGRPEPAPGSHPATSMTSVSPEYFSALGLGLREGRAFTWRDRSSAPQVAIINESLARTFWPNESPIGKRIGSPGQTHWREIVGVVSDAEAIGRISGSGLRFQVYYPLLQSPGDLALALRTHHAPETIALDVRRAVAAIDPDLPVYEVRTVHAEIARTMEGGPKPASEALAAFALLGVALAAVGIYGVVSGFVVQRTGEIGVRMALGAQGRDILALVLGQGFRLALLGILAGLVGAVGMGKVLHVVFPNMLPAENLTTAGVTVFLFGVALFACWLPARRATRVNPIEALRAE